MASLTCHRFDIQKKQPFRRSDAFPAQSLNSKFVVECLYQAQLVQDFFNEQYKTNPYKSTPPGNCPVPVVCRVWDWNYWIPNW